MTDKRKEYEGRFGTSGEASSRRPTGSFRARPSGDYKSRAGYAATPERPSAASAAPDGKTRRPSVRDAGDSYTRRPAPKAAPRPVKKAEKTEDRPKSGFAKKLIAILAVVIVFLLALIAFLGFGGARRHQLPTILPEATEEPAVQETEA